jgi:hypothetical protein
LIDQSKYEIRESSLKVRMDMGIAIVSSPPSAILLGRGEFLFYRGYDLRAILRALPVSCLDFYYNPVKTARRKLAILQLNKSANFYPQSSILAMASHT